jgi:signal transduction histidine kinase
VQVIVSRWSLLWRYLPALLFVLAGVALGLVGWRSLAAERALVEGTCRTQLEALAVEGAARLKETAAEASGLAMGATAQAVVDQQGRFLQPEEPRVRAQLMPPESGAFSARLQLADAERAEAAGDLEAARRTLLALAQEDREPLCRSLALHRLSCLERRDGKSEAADALLRTFLETLPESARETWQAVFARASLETPMSAALRDDLLVGLATTDEPIVLGLLREAALAGDGALAARRAALQWMDRVRSVSADARAQATGTRVRGSTIIAWWTAGDGRVQFAERPVPALPEHVSVVAADQVPQRADLLVASVPIDDGHMQVIATQSSLEVDAMANRHRWQFASVFALLIVGGAAALWLMRRAARREADAVRVRSQFIARVGHDVRTPLTLIRMYVETLAAGKVKDPHEAREFAGIAARESERLSKIVQKLLDFSRTLERARPLERARLDLAALAKDVLLCHRPAFDQAGVALSMIGNGQPALVAGDADALRGALGNLLENALHYAAGGGQVEVSVAAHDGVALLQVLDRGPGLPRAVRARLFDRFVRGPDEKREGTGLGLALVREIAQAHGGSVDAADREGGGAAITVMLPLERSP